MDSPSSGQADSPRPGRRFGPGGALVLLGALVAMGFVGCLLVATQGHFVPPVVDLYVICRYAQAFAEGHPFQYNAGDLPSTGATSLLHTIILAGAHALGARGEGLVAFAVLLGAVAYVLSILLARRIASRLASERAGLLGAGLVALCGPVAWGFLLGSDTALFMLLFLWFVDRLLAEYPEGRLTGSAIAGSLLALTRPEGLVIATVLVAGTLPYRRLGGRARLLAVVPLSLALGVATLYRVLTGSWGGSSVSDKALLPNYGLLDTLGVTAEYLTDLVRGLLLGFYPSQTPIGFSRGWASYFFPPLALVFVAVGALSVRRRFVRPLAIAAASAVLAVVAVTPNTFVGVHFQRYVMWVFPPLLALTAAGMAGVARWVARGNPETESRALLALAIAALSLGALSTVRFASAYGQMAGDVFRRDFSMAQWISSNLPPGVPIASIATGVEFVTGHRNMNLHGVTSPQFFGNLTAEREAGTWESLARLEIGERPPYILTSRSIQEGSALMRELVAGAPLHESLSLGDELLLLRMRWDLVGRQTRPASPSALAAIAGLVEVDRLNVCDRKAEADRHYSYESTAGGLALHGAVVVDTYGSPSSMVADGGRIILGHENMRVVTPRAGRDLVVVVRLHATPRVTVMRSAGSVISSLSLEEQAFQPEVGGAKRPRHSFRLQPGWNEVVFEIPAALLQGSATELRLRGRYAAYHYWFYQ